MTNKIRCLVAATLLAGSSGAAMAQSLSWRVSEAAGSVTIRHGVDTRPAQRGSTLSPGDSVQTGQGGRAVLVRAKDFVTVSANSRVTVPTSDQATGFTKIIQDLGNAIFKIEKLGVPHFGVNTPYLAAVVKGTTFSVTVDATGASLQVVEGAVEVATIDGGARDLIRPGDIAAIAATDLYRLRVQGDGERTIDSPARPGGSATPPADAGGTTSTSSTDPADAPVLALASASPEIVTSVDMSSQAQTIGAAISSKPVDLAGATGGMIVGTTAGAALIATIRAASITPASVPETTVPAAEPAPATPTPIAAPTPTTPEPTPATVPATAPTVTSPETTTPAVTAPEVSAPAVTTPAVTTPAVPTPEVTTPAVTTPVVTTPAVTTPVVTTPVVTAPAETTPVVTTPVVTTPVVTAPAETTPVVTTPVVTTPVVITPVVTTPVVTTPAVTVPVVTTPVVTTPVVTTPVVTTPVVTTPTVTAPVVTTPVVTTPVVTTPAVTIPVVTTPVVTTPVVTTPVVTTPVVTTPVVTPPTLIGGLIGLINNGVDILTGKNDRPGLGLGRNNNQGNGKGD